MPRKSHDGQYYFLGRWFPWLPCANDIYSNYWSYYFRSQTKVQKYFLTIHSVFQSQASGESSNEDTECVTGQLLLVSLYSGWEGLIWNANSGRTVTWWEVLTEAVAWPWTHCMTRSCAQPRPRQQNAKTGAQRTAIHSHSQGIPVGKDVHVDLSKLG